mgnify:CR=1 FL=1
MFFYWIFLSRVTIMFNKGIHKRIKIVLLIILFIFIIIIAKVFYIEVIDYKKLNSLASGLYLEKVNQMINFVKDELNNYF